MPLMIIPRVYTIASEYKISVFNSIIWMCNYVIPISFMPVYIFTIYILYMMELISTCIMTFNTSVWHMNSVNPMPNNQTLWQV